MLPDLVTTQPELLARLRQEIDAKTKPPGSLGAVEDLAVRLGLVLGTTAPVLRDPHVVVCAADHGLTAQGVSAYPAEVTAQMVEGFLAGGAAVAVLARQHGLGLVVVDCGTSAPVPPRPGLVSLRVAAGTRDSSAGPAMSAEQCRTAVGNGRELVRRLPGNAVLLGEMGIGNTSSAALVGALLLGRDVADLVGPGTGLHGADLERKREVLARVQRRHAGAVEPLDVLAAVGGLEIATLVGVVLQAAHERRVVVVDGFITTAAVLAAERLQPGVVQRCVAAHLSAEPGHAALLDDLGLQPLLRLGLRLGEGSGAVLAWPLLRSACAVLGEMATFAGAGVSGPATVPGPAT